MPGCRHRLEPQLGSRDAVRRELLGQGLEGLAQLALGLDGEPAGHDVGPLAQRRVARLQRDRVVEPAPLPPPPPRRRHLRTRPEHHAVRREQPRALLPGQADPPTGRPGSAPPATRACWTRLARRVDVDVGELHPLPGVPAPPGGVAAHRGEGPHGVLRRRVGRDAAGRRRARRDAAHAEKRCDTSLFGNRRGIGDGSDDGLVRRHQGRHERRDDGVDRRVGEHRRQGGDELLRRGLGRQRAPGRARPPAPS